MQYSSMPVIHSELSCARSGLVVMVWVILFLFSFGAAWATELQDYYEPGEIQAEIMQYLNHTVKPGNSQNITFQTGRVDEHLKLTRCNIPLSIHLGAANEINNRSTAQVSCQGLKPWRIYVPIQAEYQDKLVVAVTNLAAGTLLSAENLEISVKKREQGRNNGFFDVSELKGKVLKRSIGAGQVILASMVDNPLVIKRGQTVAILAEKGGLQVSMPGVALQDGQLNQDIEVKNKKSKRVLECRVIGRNQVKVEF